MGGEGTRSGLKSDDLKANPEKKAKVLEQSPALGTHTQYPPIPMDSGWAWACQTRHGWVMGGPSSSVQSVGG